MHTLMANIAHNPLRFGEGFVSELHENYYKKSVKKKRNMADVRDRRLSGEGFELLIINI